jgi:hypothetical protein
MPALLSPHHAIPSPLSSKPINLVNRPPLTLLKLTMHALTRDDVGIDQQLRAQTTPRDAHARQDAHAGKPGRDRTPLAPVVLTSSRPLPLSYALTVDPATSQTTPSRRGNPVRDATVDDVRRYPRQRPHALVLVSASFSSPSSPTSPP